MFILDIGELIQLGIIIILLLFLGILYLVLNVKDWLSNKKWERKNKKMEENKELAIKIIEEFEELLSKHKIKLPNKDRQGDEDEACIYGDDYYDLEEKITEILNDYMV